MTSDTTWHSSSREKVLGSRGLVHTLRVMRIGYAQEVPLEYSLVRVQKIMVLLRGLLGFTSIGMAPPLATASSPGWKESAILL